MKIFLKEMKNAEWRERQWANNENFAEVFTHFRVIGVEDSNICILLSSELRPNFDVAALLKAFSRIRPNSSKIILWGYE